MAGVRELVAPDPPPLAAVLERRNSFTHSRNDESQVEWARNAGIDVIRGHGRLTGERTVSVDGVRTLTARHAVVLATGTTAAVPRPLRAVLPWTSRDATNMQELPRRVVIVGGGVVACEAATWLLDLGAREVTMIVRGSSLLASAEPFARDRVADALRAAGARILFDTEVASVSRPDAADTGIGRIHGGEVTVSVTGAETITADEIIVAAGRTPASADLGLASVGLPEGKYVPTDDHLTAVGDWLYVVGDLNGRAALTHMGKYQARVCGDVIAARADARPLDGPRFRATADHGQIPQVVFTSPEVASVGRTEQQARADDLAVTPVELDIAVAGSSLARDDFAGHAKLVIDEATGTIVGATFVGPEVGELLHAATIAVVGKVPVETLWHAVPSYPTVSEVWLRLLERLRRP